MRRKRKRRMLPKPKPGRLAKAEGAASSSRDVGAPGRECHIQARLSPAGERNVQVVITLISLQELPAEGLTLEPDIEGDGAIVDMDEATMEQAGRYLVRRDLQAERTMEEINGWVEDEQNQRVIKDLMRGGGYQDKDL